MAREYQIARVTGQCRACGKELPPGSEFVATVREGPQDLERFDFCPACRDAAPTQGASEVLAEWRSRVPEKEEKKKLFVDDNILVQFFRRLEGATEPERLSFRFVLALVLMRKKVLVYDRLEKFPDGRDAWTMHFRQGQDKTTVIDPHMDEESIARVSQQLGQILEGEL